MLGWNGKDVTALVTAGITSCQAAVVSWLVINVEPEP